MFLTAEGRIFGLDIQLLSGMVFQIAAILLLSVALTYILYEPVRKVLNDRKQRISGEVAEARQSRIWANEYKAEYETKLENMEKEAGLILSEARKKALAKEREIVAGAKEEAARIIAHGKKEAELEMRKAQNEIKLEIIEAASLMAGKLVAVSLKKEDQAALVRETLKEMGEETWLN